MHDTPTAITTDKQKAFFPSTDFVRAEANKCNAVSLILMSLMTDLLQLNIRELIRCSQLDK